MFGNKEQKEAGRSIFTKSVSGLANVAAIGTTFIATPTIFHATQGWITDFTARNYGYAVADVIDVPWFLITAITVFFLSRATVGVAITIGGLAIAARLF